MRSRRVLVADKMSENQEKQKKRGRPVSVTLSAKKRKKAELDSKWNRSWINIGKKIIRWNQLKELMKLKTHADVAEFLIDRYAYRIFSCGNIHLFF